MGTVSVFEGATSDEFDFDDAAEDEYAFDTRRINFLNIALAGQKRDNNQLAVTLLELGALTLADFTDLLTTQNSVSDPVETLSVVSEIRSRLCELLFKTTSINTHQLQHAIELQRESGDRLSEVLISLGLLTVNDIDTPQIFDRPRQKSADMPHISHRPRQKKEREKKHQRLGDILVARKEITKQQLQEALEKQQQTGRKLGEVLVEKGYADIRQIGHALHLQNVH